MKKGNTLLENIVALAILLIAATIAVEISIVAVNSKRIRYKREEANRVAYAIESEIKYNLTIIELNNLFNGNKLTYNYSENILEELTQKPISSLENGGGIEIEKLNNVITSDNGKPSIISLRVKILDDNGGVLCEREFIKSYWMEKY